MALEKQKNENRRHVGMRRRETPRNKRSEKEKQKADMRNRW